MTYLEMLLISMAVDILFMILFVFLIWGSQEITWWILDKLEERRWKRK